MMKTLAWIIRFLGTGSFLMTAGAQQSMTTLRLSARLVEVPVTVMDSRGHYVDGLRQGNFNVTENGQAQKIKYFEGRGGFLSCAEATESGRLNKVLTDLSKNTGGETYQIKDMKDIEEIFLKISTELHHIYLIPYSPLEPDDGKWRHLEVDIADEKATAFGQRRLLPEIAMKHRNKRKDLMRSQPILIAIPNYYEFLSSTLCYRPCS